MNKTSRLLVLMVSTILILNIGIPEKLEATIYGTVQGRAIDERTGQGVKGVEVVLWNQSTERRKGEKKSYGPLWTDQDGRFAFDMVVEGKYIIQFTPPEPYVPDHTQEPLAGTPEYPGDTRQIVTVEKGKIVYFTKVLRIGGTISGLVYKKTNGILSPMKKREADVSAYVSTEKYVSYSAFTDDNGKYKLSGLDPRYSYKIASYSTGFGRKYLDNVTVTAGEIKSGVNFTYDFDDKTGIELTVVSSIDGGPLEDVTTFIRYIISSEESDSVPSKHTDRFGKSLVLNIEPGMYRISINVYIDDQLIEGKLDNIFVEKGKTSNILMTLDIPSK